MDFHPSEDIDLCAMLFQPIIEQAKTIGKTIYSIPFTQDIIWDSNKLKELSAVEEVLMTGYPIGLWDQKHNYPIFRRGITANHPAIDFNGESIGIVDVAAFPGSSGSPVMIINEGRYSTKTGGLVVGNRAVLLGILYGGPVYNAQGEMKIKNILTLQRNMYKTAIPTNIGFYVKAKEVVKLGQYIIDKLKQEGKL